MAIGHASIADGVQQVGLSQAYTAVEEEWIVSAGGVLGDCLGGCVCQPVVGANYEALEIVAGN
jgi:hypothetical protein